jgi:hypothetical protein
MRKTLKSNRQKKTRAEGAGSEAKSGAREIEKTVDGHYVVIDGRRWRATNPSIGEEERQRLVNELMQARRDVGKALREGDKDAELEARARVHRAKVELGERGPKWWDEHAEKK